MQVSTIAEQLFFTIVSIDTTAANVGQGSARFYFLYRVGEQGFQCILKKKVGSVWANMRSILFAPRTDTIPSSVFSEAFNDRLLGGLQFP